MEDVLSLYVNFHTHPKDKEPTSQGCHKLVRISRAFFVMPQSYVALLLCTWYYCGGRDCGAPKPGQFRAHTLQQPLRPWPFMIYIMMKDDYEDVIWPQGGHSGNSEQSYTHGFFVSFLLPMALILRQVKGGKEGKKEGMFNIALAPTFMTMMTLLLHRPLVLPIINY